MIVDFTPINDIVYPSFKTGGIICRQQEKNQAKERIGVINVGSLSVLTMILIPFRRAPSVMALSLPRSDDNQKQRSSRDDRCFCFERALTLLFCGGFLRGALLLCRALFTGAAALLAGGGLVALLRIVAKEAAQQRAAEACRAVVAASAAEEGPEQLSAERRS